ncbi:MAG: hypothetical protein J7483_10990 [Novosphingobium sp.]|nr:hypothetical protein [Novosphingobium sp.]
MTESRMAPEFPGIFTLERRVRFLDHLAVNGNARAAAAHVRISHDTAYRARRQDPQLAELWDAALVHAREQSAAVLATRALDGVEVPVWYHGEVVGTRTVHDPRLLLAHMARLDRQVEGNAPALARAERFDELLAVYAGLPEPAHFAEAAEQALDWRERGSAPALPPSREDYVIWLRSLAAGGRSKRAEAGAMAEAGEAAGAVWDAWRDDGRALVGAILADRDGAAEAGTTLALEGPREPPIEYKSAALGLAPRRRAFSPLDRVAGVRSAAPPASPRSGSGPRGAVTKSLWRGAGEAL